MKVVSVINIKGGVGKTTLVANLGAELASRGYRVLLIDLDPQASLTFSFFTIQHWNNHLARDKTIKRWFDPNANGQGPVRLSDLISTPDLVKPAIQENGGTLDIIASHLGLMNIDVELAASLGGGTFTQVRDNFRIHRRLADELRERAFRRAYDVILIDCAPNLNVLNKSALIASDWVLIPARADHLSTLGIEYLVKYLKTLIDGYNNFTRIRAEGDPRIPRINPDILGVVFTMIQVRSDEPIKASKTFIEEVQGLEGVPVFDGMIRLNTALFALASRDGVPVSVKSSVPAHIALELDDLAQEFIEKAELKRIGS